MKCTTPYFAGLGDCQKLMQKVIGIGLLEKGTTFTKTTFISETAWNVGISSVTAASRNATVLPFTNYERTTSDATINETNLGYKDKDSDPAPSLQGWLDISYCDYKTLFDLEGTAFEAVLFLQDNTQFGTRKSDGTVKGFRCKLNFRKDLPPSDNNQSSYPVEIHFRSAQEFENGYIDDPDYTFDDILDMVPVGIDVSILTEYAAGGVVVVKAVNRCTNNGHTGFLLADWVVLESNAKPTVTVSVMVDDGLGQYTLTIRKDMAGVPADFVAGEYAIIQVTDEDATPTYLTYMSHSLKISG